MLLIRFFLLTLLFVASNMVQAAGYALVEQSVTGLGRAFSGSAAVAEDASTIFFNPAGLTQLSRSELIVGGNYIVPSSKFDDRDSQLPNGQPLSGGNGGDAADNALLPNFYVATPVNDRLVVGLGIGAPFGLVTDYGNDWIGRYHAQRSDLKTVNINPSFGYQLSDKLSFGAGISAQYAEIELSQAIDFGTPLMMPQGLDGQAKVKADDWGWGYNLGLTYQFTAATRLGISYRSKIDHDFSGDGRFRIPKGAEPVANAGGLRNGNVRGDVTLPEMLSIALHHQINPQWAIMADATWTRWQRFDALIIESDVPALNSEKRQDWKNSMRYGLGLTYTASPRWTWRAGIAYDETPVANAQRRTPRIPDNDRTWLAMGVSYAYSDNIVLDVAYAHLFMSDSRIDDTDSNGYRLRGSYESHVDIVGAQLRWHFD